MGFEETVKDRVDRDPEFRNERLTRIFLDKIYILSLQDKDRHAVDIILDFIDDLLNRGLFTRCDSVLESVNTDYLNDPMIISLLGITKAAKDELDSRDSFYQRAWKSVAKTRGVTDTNILLRKYY